MNHPLIDRLTQGLGWPVIDGPAALDAFAGRTGLHVVFVPGDPARNLESTDAAVILPELVRAFRGSFDCAVCAPAHETALREATGVFKTPSLIFFRDGVQVGDIQKLRDWDDYLARTGHIAALPVAAE